MRQQLFQKRVLAELRWFDEELLVLNKAEYSALLVMTTSLIMDLCSSCNRWLFTNLSVNYSFSLPYASSATINLSYVEGISSKTAVDIYFSSIYTSIDFSTEVSLLTQFKKDRNFSPRGIVIVKKLSTNSELIQEPMSLKKN